MVGGLAGSNPMAPSEPEAATEVKSVARHGSLS